MWSHHMEILQYLSFAKKNIIFIFYMKKYIFIVETDLLSKIWGHLVESLKISALPLRGQYLLIDKFVSVRKQRHLVEN